MQVIPALNATSYEEAKAQLQKIARTGAQVMHIDIADGKFTPRTTWGTPEEIQKLLDEVGFHPNIELHLMTQNTERSLEAWCVLHPYRIIVHAEELSDIHFAANACNSCSAELMIGITPKTSVDTLEQYRDITNAFQILAVIPGESGQVFQEEVIHKIETLRKKIPGATIEVDGGITPEVIHRCKEVGADTFVSASFILKHEDPRVAYETLLASLA